NGDGQHQRWLAYRFTAKHHSRFRGALQKLDVKHVGHFGPGGQLICRCSCGREPALGIPHEFLKREPTGALQESAFYLAAIDERTHRIADILENVGAQQATIARESVDLYFRYRGSEGKIVERLAAASLVVEVDIGGAVIALREQRNALQIRGSGDLGERFGALRIGFRANAAVLETNQLDIAGEEFRCNWHE